MSVGRPRGTCRPSVLRAANTAGSTACRPARFRVEIALTADLPACQVRESVTSALIAGIARRQPRRTSWIVTAARADAVSTSSPGTTSACGTVVSTDKAEAFLHNLVELLPFFVHHRTACKRRQIRPQLEQRRHARGRIVRVELRDDFVRLFANFRAAGHARPGGVNAIHDVVGRRLAGEHDKT